jgi:soluble lytic murein transglycosylase-like protein
LLLVSAAPGWALGGNGFYSYVDENGVKVLTNLGAGRAALEQPADGEPSAGQNFLPLIQTYARRYGIDEDLVAAIIQVESAFNPRAVSVKNCKGLMQLHPDTARRFGVTDIFDPAQNIEGGVKYLSHLIETFGRDLDHVLAAYNAGENTVRRYSGIPPYPETVDYVSRVRSLYGGKLKPPEPSRRAQRILRLVEEDGTVLLTNVATESR